LLLLLGLGPLLLGLLALLLGRLLVALAHVVDPLLLLLQLATLLIELGLLRAPLFVQLGGFLRASLGREISLALLFGFALRLLGEISPRPFIGRPLGCFPRLAVVGLALAEVLDLALLRFLGRDRRRRRNRRGATLLRNRC